MKEFRFQSGTTIEVTNADYLLLKSLESKRFSLIAGEKPLIDQVDDCIRVADKEITAIVNSTKPEVSDVVSRLVLNQLLRIQKR